MINNIEKYTRIISLDISLLHTGVCIFNGKDSNRIKEYEISFKPKSDADVCMEEQFSNWYNELNVTDSDLVLIEDNRFNHVFTRGSLWQTYFMKAAIFYVIAVSPNIMGINNSTYSTTLFDLFKRPDLKDEAVQIKLNLPIKPKKPYTYSQSVVKKAFSLMYYELITKNNIDNDNIADARGMFELYRRGDGKWKIIR